MSIQPILKAGGQALEHVLFPPSCLACERRTAAAGALCVACWQNARFMERPFCEILGTPFPQDFGQGTISPEAMADPPVFRRCRAALAYSDVARRLVSALKFGDQTNLAPWMARLMLTAGRELLDEVDLVVPLPLHRRRLWSRRYNQSAELARAIAGQSGLAYAPLVLKRVKATRRQVGLGLNARKTNVQGAFKVLRSARPAVFKKNVLLIDDVYTTGSTVGAAAGACLRAGASAVDVLVFARVVGDGDETLYA